MGILEQPQSLQQVLRGVFLRGEKVVATRFATQYGFTRQGVSEGLKAMRKRGLIQPRELERASAGTAPIEWSCVDLAAMQAYQPKVQTHNPMVARRRPTGPFAALLEVWGIRPADIRLPTMRHVMITNDPAEAA
ncbi:putative transcriptional regulator [Cupriavidus metallidurans]|jgi:predicted transcriptional regulator|uniref:hypothetical protein n=1 Tax=Cupriavidus TaxID=106589 RepID=UPI00046B6B35|nr:MULTISPECIES: hypothetical protein [Cupriavidus]KWR75592.1 hypothetical protein RN01_29245 [Cupriavidus sp. SHE]MDE4918574.1 hypothetical protein [Cupriavidus metallidurans]